MTKAVSKSVSMPVETWELIEKRAPETPGRDRSGYISNLVTEDLKASGILTAPTDEDEAEYHAATLAVGGKKYATQILRRAARRKVA